MDHRLKEHSRLIESEINQLPLGNHPQELYEPIHYIMKLGGKRMRPLLTVIAYNLYKPDIESIVKYAVAVEVFHNFTLLHDDIMDQAPLRRGKPTVHEKWNHNTAILSGDVMLVKAYDLFMDLEAVKLTAALKAFNDCAAKVCEGQQIDMNFETRDGVQEKAYIEMITLKTAVLLGYSLELGAILGEASTEDRFLLKTFGENIGIGFQLKDDLLDVYADKDKFGKQVGGDIIANKKTFLLIKAMELANEEQVQKLNFWLQQKQFDPEEKVKEVKAIYDQLHIRALVEDKMNYYFEEGFNALGKLTVTEEKKNILQQFAKQLINREK